MEEWGCLPYLKLMSSCIGQVLHEIGLPIPMVKAHNALCDLRKLPGMLKWWVIWHTVNWRIPKILWKRPGALSVWSWKRGVELFAQQKWEWSRSTRNVQHWNIRKNDFDILKAVLTKEVHNQPSKISLTIMLQHPSYYNNCKKWITEKSRRSLSWN